MTDLALFNLDPRVGLGGNVFGKDVANFRLFQALARHGGFGRCDFLMTEAVPPERVAASLLDGGPGAEIATTHILDQGAAARAGALLRGSGKLEEVAWLRRRHAGDAGYSLVGVIHTLGPPAIRADLAAASVSPVQPWDAVVCTSPAVHDATVRMFDEWEDFLRDRFGGARAPRPQLPVIPLGVDADAMAAQSDRPEARAATRERLGLGGDDVLLLWVGRLSFFEKAFPQPMFRAAEEAARATGRRVAFAMVGWFPAPEAQEPMYRAAAAAYAPSVEFRIVNGNDAAQVADMWAAADIFVSLVDNIQETFGLTPIEAMACALPVVVSDWDGYRYTVRDGAEGFLIPTLGGPAGGLPDGLLDGHAIGAKSYQQYVGVVAQHTAVHVGRAAEAIAALIRSPDLRRRMGEAGRARVRAMVDWPVVARQYRALIEELAARRLGAAGRRAEHPVAGDPFRDFAGFASAVLTAETRLSLRPGADAGDVARAQRLELDMFGGNWRGSPAEAARIVALLADGPRTVRELADAFPPARRRAIRLSLMWLAKLGTLDWLAVSPPPAA